MARSLGHVDHALFVYGMFGQIGSGSIPCVVAQRDGGSNPRLGADSRRHDGKCRTLFVGSIWRSGKTVACGDDGDHDCRRNDRAVRCDRFSDAERHQKDPRLFHDQPNRLHDHDMRPRGVCGGHFPYVGSWVFEGLPVLVDREPARIGRLARTSRAHTTRAHTSRAQSGPTETVGAVIHQCVDPGLRPALADLFRSV